MSSPPFLFKKAHRWARILGLCPGVRAIFLSGSVAQGTATEKSDIDFFIIAREGRIWTARFFVFLVLKMCGQLSKPHHHEQRICPNHFITHTHLLIQEQDAYAAHLFTANVPLYDPHLIFPRFVQENKDWVQRFGTSFSHSVIRNNTKDLPILNPGNFFTQLIESFLRRLQIRKIKSNPEYNLPGAKIVLEDTELRFHPKPKNKTFTPPRA